MQLPARYKKIRELDGGGMSDVVLCKDGWLDRLVVAKKAAPNTEHSRLLDEIHSLQKIRSNHVVQIYDVFFEADGRFGGIIEEYCEGSDLTGVTFANDINGFIGTVYQLACGIDEIHRHNIIHRDIKPSNVRRGSDGWLRIIDFGLSRSTGTAASTMSEIGTAGFMAPELFGNPGSPIPFSSAIDMYALGITAFLLGGGTIPTDARRRPPRLPQADLDFSRLPLGLSPDLTNALNKCLSVDPSVRPKAEALREDLEKVLLQGKHRALLNMNGKPYELNSDNPRVRASVGSIGNVVIQYDGNVFKVDEVTGNISVNNRQIVGGYVLPHSCVIAFGGPELKGRRRFVTFDMSHPGVKI